MAIHCRDLAGAPETHAASDALVTMNMSNDPLMDALRTQAETIEHLTGAIERLSTLVSPPSPPEPICQSQQLLQSLYRTWHSKSRAKEDENGDLISGNRNWPMESEDDIALHFAEFHSEKSSKKDTALISVTHDPIRAIKAAYQEWNHQPFDTRDAKQIFISVIYSSDSYSAKALKERALAAPLCLRLSRKAHNRLSEPKNSRLYDSERLFVTKIPKEQIRVRVSLQDLLDRKLLDDMLPELCKEHEFFGGRLGPSAIRSRIHCDGAADKVAGRFKTIYCALAGVGTTKPKQSSLRIAQQLMQDDPALDECAKEVGLDMVEKEILRLRVRAVPARFLDQ